MLDLALIFLLVTITWYWWDTMLCKEIARKAGKDACDRANTQFLDDTVEKKKIWVRRNHLGKLELCRLFFFEFTSDGSQRYQGRIVILGKQVSELEMDAYRI
ncbi:MAG: DUF3301 domain-containing protein [Gammaproteobacteria bacterium]|nr:DUF3301 domain-containing protein [Gammaproteobacteria bacterium]